MTISTIFELIGYLGSLLVIVSMLMTSVVKLRIINTIGSVIFAAYALLIHSYPTAALQFALIIINIVNLRKLFNVKKEYSIVKSNSIENFTEHFLLENQNDIKKYFPDFSPVNTDVCVYLICCHSDCAGILIGSKFSDDSLLVALDYTTTAFRDTSVGKFLYTKLKEDGIKKLVVQKASAGHEQYLLKMGFKKENESFIKQL